MAASYEKSKGRKSKYGGYFALPKSVIEHPNFMKLRSHAYKLLIDLGQQYKGKNNGDLCATWGFMKKRGWRSKATLNKSLRELEYYGFIVCTQIGGLNRPSLYAISWNKIDKASKEVDWNVGDQPGTWKEQKTVYVHPKKKQVQQEG